MATNTVFQSFAEYWYYARFLTDKQKELLFKSFSDTEKEGIMTSYIKDGWSDLFVRNSIDKIIDEIKDATKYDLLEIRAKVLMGKSVYIPKSLWQMIIESLHPYEKNATQYVIGDIHAVKSSANPNVVLLTKEYVSKD